MDWDSKAALPLEELRMDASAGEGSYEPREPQEALAGEVGGSVDDPSERGQMCEHS
jgi:hypothetical protein